jgi:PKHD-type hydroxylase|tara:strand:- start:403 stop:996 length:594 start_codon:yes stop_codon:yes gene_type:complete
MKSYLYDPIRNKSMDYYYFDGGFSPSELEQISRMVENLPFHKAVTVAGETEDRKSRLKWIPQNDEWNWLYEKLMKFAKEANDRMWNFDLISAPEYIQYTEYHGSDRGEYGWHQDIGPDELSTRKVSITVQLSDDNEYEGGDLSFWMGGNSLEDNNITAPKGKGTVVLFPSYLVHAVKPVTKGIRKSFVLWLGGGHYK